MLIFIVFIIFQISYNKTVLLWDLEQRELSNTCSTWQVHKVYKIFREDKESTLDQINHR